MSTTASLPRRTVSRRTQILASASALVAAASVAVTLAVAGGGDGQTTVSQPSSSPATAQPTLATQYRNDAATGDGAQQDGVPNAADRFHHFR
jgi:hypothetical protein